MKNRTTKTIRDISSAELIKEMKVGCSFGNTLDSTGTHLYGAQASTIETAWGNPVITKSMVDKVKERGFNVLRIPVTWENSMGESPDYCISAEFLARVAEVVDYGIDNDMFVILNIHHESWHFPTEENYPDASRRLKKVWTQIGNYFEDYDEKLIFEGMNEPRVIGSEQEWTGGNESGREIVNRLNFDFVKTVRSLAANNEKRHLMIPSYAASPFPHALKSLSIPKNDDKIIVSVHAYLPYNFALADNGTRLWRIDEVASTYEIDGLANTLKKLFTDKGQAVIIGEFGARSRDNEEYRAEWVKYYITRMNSIGIPCIWWDNSAFSGSGELFGLLDRRTLEWRYTELVNALFDAVDGKYTIEQLIAEGAKLF